MWENHTWLSQSRRQYIYNCPEPVGPEFGWTVWTVPCPITLAAHGRNAFQKDASKFSSI